MTDARRSRIALLALGLACFVSVTSENLPVALIPPIAADFGVSDSAVGYLVSGYAVVVAVTAVPFVSATARWDRRRAALLTIALVAAANLLLAVAPTYPVAVVARVVAALGHGVFWSIVAPIAARLAGDADAGRATGTVFAGNAVAFIVGLPLASALGASVGWRLSVVVIAVLAAVSALAVRVTVPPLPGRAADAPPAAGGVRALARNRPLVAVVAAALLLVFGHFTAWTYITLLLDHYAHVRGAGVSAVLLANGVTGLIGLLLVRRDVDDRPRRTSAAVAAWLCACMVTLLTAGPHSAVVALVAVAAWGTAAGGMAIVLQAAVLRTAAAAADLASAVYVVAFQIGIAGGAGLGGRLVDQRALPLTLLVAASCSAVVTAIVLRSRRAFPPAARGRAPQGGAAPPAREREQP